MVEHGRKKCVDKDKLRMKQILKQYIIFVSRRARDVLLSFARSYWTLVRSILSDDW